jgi:hypothetical protein
LRYRRVGEIVLGKGWSAQREKRQEDGGEEDWIACKSEHWLLRRLRFWKGHINIGIILQKRQRAPRDRIGLT